MVSTFSNQWLPLALLLSTFGGTFGISLLSASVQELIVMTKKEKIAEVYHKRQSLANIVHIKSQNNTEAAVQQE